MPKLSPVGCVVGTPTGIEQELVEGKLELAPISGVALCNFRNGWEFFTNINGSGSAFLLLLMVDAICLEGKRACKSAWISSLSDATFWLRGKGY